MWFMDQSLGPYVITVFRKNLPRNQKIFDSLTLELLIRNSLPGFLIHLSPLFLSHPQGNGSLCLCGKEFF